VETPKANARLHTGTEGDDVGEFDLGEGVSWLSVIDK
jgi:hypothetical protein